MTLDQSKAIHQPQREFIIACGGKLKDPTKYPSIEYRGERVYFCTQACLDAFQLNPDPFMAGEIEHPA